MGEVVDAGTAALFAVASIFAWAAWRSERGRRDAAFWAIASLGLALLAANELFNLQEWGHEKLHQVGFGDPPFLQGIDDLLMLIGGGIGLAICGIFRHEFMRDRRAFAFFAASIVLLAVAVLNDSFERSGGPFSKPEEVLELAASAATAVGMALRWQHAKADRGQLIQFGARATAHPRRAG
ncbi:MAG: hypothetical protein ACM3S1_12420 [Hyphomicrobiales bacterium]